MCVKCGVVCLSCMCNMSLCVCGECGVVCVCRVCVCARCVGICGLFCV